VRRILALSDTHGYWDKALIPYIEAADEIWHAGDIGDLGPFLSWCNNKTLRMVWGNIDTINLRTLFSETLYFKCESLHVCMVHIAGKAHKHPQSVKAFLNQNPTDILVCGHSHMCQIAQNLPYSRWFINPGACGKEGFHRIRTAVQFAIKDAQLLNVEVIEFGKRSLSL